MHSFSPNRAFQKQGPRNVGENTLDFRGETSPTEAKGPTEGKDQKASMAISWLHDLEQVTDSLCLHFFPHLSNGDNKSCSEVSMR